MTNISIYIPIYNGEQYIGKTLEAVFNQSVKFAEVIIVDDGSGDNSVAVAKQFPVRVITHEENKGIAQARNTGIKHCTHELIASVDADCVLNPDWLETCLPYFEDPLVVGVGGKLNEGEHRCCADWWRSVNLIQHFGEQTKTVAYLSGSNTIFRKANIISVGLYNTSYRKHHEDVDVCARLMQSA